MEYLLGIDIGTTGAKTVLADTNGKVAATATEDYPLVQPKLSWAEQNPEDWWRATAAGIRRVLAETGIDAAAVKGVGLSGQMHGSVLLDAAGRVVRPAIIWCDQRTTEQCAWITEKVGAERLIEITANPALTGFTAGKILWVRQHEPELFARVRHILLPKDYIRYRLTGEFATEVSDASGMQLLDVAKRQWSGEILERLDLDPDLLARVYESPEVTGTVTAQTAELTGLKAGTPVVGGGGDQAAGAVGNGIVRTGAISCNLGTSGVVFAHTDTPRIDPKGRVHTFCHAVPGAWHVMGVTQGAGLSFRWLRDVFCREEAAQAVERQVDPYEVMTEAAAAVPPGSEGLFYLPYLMGERTPHLDPNAKGVFFGLAPAHTKPHAIRAVMEGVTYSLRDCLAIIKEMGNTAKEIRLSGGGSRSDLWRRMQADIFGSPVAITNSSEGSAFGAALLAGVGAGIYPDVPAACDSTIKNVEVIEPDKAAAAVYERMYPFYQRLYRDLKDAFAEHAGLV